jgi:hypothetical protein
MLLDIHRGCLRWVEHYETNVPHLSSCIQKYFDHFLWHKYDPPHEKYSPKVFTHWRGIDSTNINLIGLMTVIQNAVVPQRIREHPCWKQIENVGNLGGAVLNDALGLRKAWTQQEQDRNNLIEYFITRDQLTVENAVEKVCHLLEEAYSDYLLCKGVLLAQFDNDQKLRDWCDIVEANLDNNWQLYKYSKRFYNDPDFIEIV